MNIDIKEPELDLLSAEALQIISNKSFQILLDEALPLLNKQIKNLELNILNMARSGGKEHCETLHLPHEMSNMALEVKIAYLEEFKASFEERGYKISFTSLECNSNETFITINWK